MGEGWALREMESLGCRPDWWADVCRVSMYTV